MITLLKLPEPAVIFSINKYLRRTLCQKLTLSLENAYKLYTLPKFQ